MQSGIVEQARQAAAAAAARSERAAREAAALPPVASRRRYRGVQKRGGKYVATVWNGAARRAVWLGSYDTPEEAAYAYDAGARCVQGRWARPNFPAPAAAAGEALASAARDGDVRAAAEVITGLAQARRAAAHQEPAAAHDFHSWTMPAPPPAAAGQHQQQQPAGPAAFPYGQRAVPPFLQFFYRAASVASVLNRPVSSALSSTEPAVESSSAAAPTRREVATAAAIEPGQSVVGDNFTDDGASSSVAPMPGEAQ